MKHTSILIILHAKRRKFLDSLTFRQNLILLFKRQYNSILYCEKLIVKMNVLNVLHIVEFCQKMTMKRRKTNKSYNKKNTRNKIKCTRQRAQTFISNVKKYQKLQEVNFRIAQFNIVVKVVDEK